MLRSSDMCVSPCHGLSFEVPNGLPIQGAFCLILEARQRAGRVKLLCFGLTVTKDAGGTMLDIAGLSILSHFGIEMIQISAANAAHFRYIRTSFSADTIFQGDPTTLLTTISDVLNRLLSSNRDGRTRAADPKLRGARERSGHSPSGWSPQSATHRASFSAR
jgi:hypothetical protein